MTTMTQVNQVRFPHRLTATDRLPVNERVYHQVKSMIARGELSPGTPLIVRDLADRLKVSRTPIVEAIRRLQHDGLVTSIPKWGAAVKQWTWEEILEVHYIRRALEGEAAMHFVSRATPEDKRKLVALNDEFDRCTLSDRDRVEEADIELHLHIARSTRFARLYDLIENSHIETMAFSGLAVLIGGIKQEDILANVGHHAPLVEKLLGDDPEAAKQELMKSLDPNLQIILRFRDSAGVLARMSKSVKAVDF